MISATPKSWYYVGSSQDLKIGQSKSIEIGQQSVQIIRTKDGHVKGFSARCPHMKTELKNSFDPRTEKFVCPMHNWVFNTNGQCLGIPGAGTSLIPDWAKLSTYPVVEKWGGLFLFLNQTPYFPLPFFEDLKSDEVSWSDSFNVFQNNHWYMAAANGFDLHHFQYVHHRHVLSFKTISNDSNYNRHITIEFENRSTKIQDKLMCAVYGSRGCLDFSVWGGNFVLATLKQGKLRNHMMIINKPAELGRSEASFILFTPKGKNIFARLKSLLILRLQAFFTKIFFKEEARMAGGVDLPQNPGPRDEVLWKYKSWLEDLTQKELI
ncbi:MAG: Rieske 2Fe-2S domain-containing protein [Bdellovibrionales bacterium]